jgi:hypothetical protein
MMSPLSYATRKATSNASQPSKSSLRILFSNKRFHAFIHPNHSP